MSAGRLQHLCGGECYNPTNERLHITRIEIVRIRPQIRRGEDVAGLIEDVWRSFPCKDEGQGCVVEFTDPDFARSRRDARIGQVVVFFWSTVQGFLPATIARHLGIVVWQTLLAGRWREVEPQ